MQPVPPALVASVMVGHNNRVWVASGQVFCTHFMWLCKAALLAMYAVIQWFGVARVQADAPYSQIGFVFTGSCVLCRCDFELVPKTAARCGFYPLCMMCCICFGLGWQFAPGMVG